MHFNFSSEEAGLDVWPPSSASELRHQEPDTQAILTPGTGGCAAVGTCSFEAASGGRRWVCVRLRNSGGLTGRQHGVLCSSDPNT